MKLFGLILFTVFINGTVYSQDCGSDEKVDWKFVEIRILETKDSEPSGYKVTGEAVVKTKKPISSIG